MPRPAVLFDFDGVLADTENVHVAAWQRTLGAMGWAETDEACARATEVDDRAFCAEVFARHQVEGDVAGWVRKKQDLTRQLLADAPRLYPGVADLIAHLRARATLAVVTTTWRENVDVVLGAAGLRDAFAVVVAKEDVAEPKPSPAPYRLALDRLGIAARRAVAVEDSPTGLRSARAAGLRVVAVGHRQPAADWAAGAPYLADLTNLAITVEALGVR